MLLTEKQLRNLIEKELLSEGALIAGIIIGGLFTLCGAILSAHQSKFQQKTARSATPSLLKMKRFLSETERMLKNSPNAQKINSDGEASSLRGPIGMAALKAFIEEFESDNPGTNFQPKHMKTLALLCNDAQNCDPKIEEVCPVNYCEDLTDELTSALECIARDISSEFIQALEYWQYDHAPVLGDIYQLGTGVDKGDHLAVTLSAAELVAAFAAANPIANAVGGWLEFFGSMREMHSRNDCLDRVSNILEQLEKLEAYAEGQDVDFDEIDSGKYFLNKGAKDRLKRPFGRIEGGRPLPKSFGKDIPIDVLFPEEDAPDTKPGLPQPQVPLPIGTVLKRKPNYRYGYQIIDYSMPTNKNMFPQPKFGLVLKDILRPEKKLSKAMEKEALELFDRELNKPSKGSK